MTDLRQQLHDLVDRVPVGPAPIDAMLGTHHRLRRFAPAGAFAAAAAIIAALVFALPGGRRAEPPVTNTSNRIVTLTPQEAVRGAQVHVTVTGLQAPAGTDVFLAVTTVDISAEQGVASGRIDAEGRLAATFTMPNTLGDETPVEPGEYRLSLVAKDVDVVRFDHRFRVVAAAIGSQYAMVPTYECLDYTWFDGRLWKLDGGDLANPVPGSTFALAGGDRATYTAPDGRTAAYSRANPAEFDPVTFGCSAQGPGDTDPFAAPVRATTTVGAPTDLPKIASLRDSWVYPNGHVHYEYHLAGPANADTATPAALAANPRSPAVHAATYLAVDFNPNVGTDAVAGVGKLQIPADPTFNNIDTVDVNGAIGKLTTSKNGLGVIRLDWVDADGNYHVVMVDRLQTSAGLSGLSAKQILAVGRSIE